MRRACLLVAVLLAGCKQIGEEIDEHYSNDLGIIVTITSPLVTGETGYGSLADECTEQDEAEHCDTDVWTASAVTCTSLWYCVPVAGTQFMLMADVAPGTGSVTITATSEGRMQTVGGSVSVEPPEAAVPSPDCSNPQPNAPPFLIPAATEIEVAWMLVLGGKQRHGDTGEVMVDAPDFTFVDYGKRYPHAWFVSPTTPGTYPVRSTLGEATFDYEVYAPDALTIDVLPTTSVPGAPNSFEMKVVGNVGGAQTCDDPGKKTIVSETPDVCLLRKWYSDEPSAMVETTSILFVTPLTTGTCRYTITLAGSPVTRTVDVDVAPIP